MSLTPGEYRGRIESYGIGETQAKEPQAVVTLAALDLGELTPAQYDAGEFDSGREFELSGEKITWFGSFAPLTPGKTISAKEITLETLRKLGFNGDFGAFSDGVSGGSVDISKIYSFQVVENVYQNKTSLRVSSIWKFGDAGPGARILSSGDARAKLSGLGLEGEFKKLQAKAGGGPENAAPSAPKKTEEKKTGNKAKF